MSDVLVRQKEYIANEWSHAGGRPALERYDEVAPIVEQNTRLQELRGYARKPRTSWFRVEAKRDETSSQMLAALQSRQIAAALECSLIDAFEHLSEEWKGTDRNVPSARVRQIAKFIVSSLPNSIPLPQVRPTADGEIVLIWSYRLGKVEAVIDSDSIVAWVARIGSNAQADAQAWNGRLPISLFAALLSGPSRSQ